MTRHKRFLLAFTLGLLVVAISFAWPLRLELRALAGVDAFCFCYLALMLRLTEQSRAQTLRRTSETADEGSGLIVLLAAIAVTASVTGIVLVLNGPEENSIPARLAALISVPLGWAMVHTLAAFHYAHLFYRPEGVGSHEGLKFPDTEEPVAWDFVYFSFVIGMAAQVSDVVVSSGRMRRVVLIHSVAAFFYNTVILALAVNAAVTMAG